MREPLYLWPQPDHNEPPRPYSIGRGEQQRADADQQSAPDDFYYEAAGQEPVEVEQGGNFIKGCLNAIWMSIVLWGFLAFVAPPLVGWVVRMMGA